ncbi:hypothetical protein EG240_04950 [Paenimyroides tangerinum]|uniref:Uncharacterized protein n=1 Tax=Paenimyroides tangerinum TaxID=2488728 RepID=A0A3P3WE49_9FLAO|nr:hypothetical protein [Paenimyroides tangerinum]RRJ91909.1 hypothetical protein EG240_04950 [Paenimyroides tangerinum]
MEQFEKNIKEKLNERKIQPSAQAWDKLEMMLNDQEVKTTKKSPRTYLFIAASILVFVSLGTFFFKMNSDSIEPNVIQIQPTENLVIEENRNEEVEEIEEAKSHQNEVVSEPKIIKAKSENKAIAHLPKIEKEQLNELEVKVDREIVSIEENKQEIVEVQQEKQEIPTSKVDPKKLLMVAEYEKNVEKSASQFKQMKHKFEEVKTALNNINQ